MSFLRLACISLAVAAGLAAGETATAPATQIRVAAISFVPSKGDVTANADRLEQAFRQAAAGGAKLAVAPEGALDGYLINEVLAGRTPVAETKRVALPIDDPLIRRFQALADTLDLCVVFGFAERIGGEIFNTAVFIDHAGAIRGKYHKMIFEEGYHEGWWFNRLGRQSRAFETPFGRCGILICNDRWNPELARIPALDGAQFLVIPAFGSTSSRQDDAVLGRARETNLPVVEANVGVSLVVSEGQIAAVKREREGIVFAEITIPSPRRINAPERDATERDFLTWRSTEMQRRYQAKNHWFGRAPAGSTAAPSPAK